MPQRWKTVLSLWGPVLAWAGVIYFFSSRPDLPRIDEPWLELVLRKAAHIAEYAIFGALLARAVGARKGQVVIAAALGAGYAASDEWHQTFVPTRKGNPLDVALDTAATLLGAYVYVRLRRHATRPQHPDTPHPDTDQHTLQ
jgi:VanZ family protein